MLVPNIKQYTFNEDLGATEMQDGVAAPLSFLYAQPRVLVFLTADQAVGTGGGFKLVNPFNGEANDNDTMHDAITNPSRITFTTAGVYLVGAQLSWASNAAGRREIEIRVNAAGAPGGGSALCRAAAAPTTGVTVLSCARPAGVGAGTHIELFAFQDSGGALNALLGVDSTFMWAVRLGT